MAAHGESRTVLALEALDEMGICPVAIAGTSMGAVVGGTYAAGIKGRGAIRTHILRVLRDRSDVMNKLLRARVGRFADLVLRGRGNPVLLDPEICSGQTVTFPEFSSSGV